MLGARVMIVVEEYMGGVVLCVGGEHFRSLGGWEDLRGRNKSGFV